MPIKEAKGDTQKMKTMGKRIAQKREEKHMTMEELGAKLGVTKSTISKWERGEVEHIKRSYIDKLCDIFQCPPQWLMGFEGAENVKITYFADDKETVTAIVDKQPIIGSSSKRANLYKVALDVKPENIDIAINILKSLC